MKDAKIVCFFLLLAVISIGLACSGTYKNGNLNISTTFSPLTSTNQKVSFNAADFAMQQLPSSLLYCLTLSNGLTLACDIDNNWISFDSSGYPVLIESTPPEVPTFAEANCEALIVTTSQGSYLFEYSENTACWSSIEIFD